MIAVLLGPAYGLLYLKRIWFGLLYWIVELGITGLWSIEHLAHDVEYKEWTTLEFLTYLPYVLAALHCIVLIWQGVLKRHVREWHLGHVVIIVLLILGVSIYTAVIKFEVTRLAGQSMMPTIKEGEYVLTERLSYHDIWALLTVPDDEDIPPPTLPKRGEMVAFYHPELSDKRYIRRVVALPGDWVEVKQGQFYVNDVALTPLLNTCGEQKNEEQSLDGMRYEVIQSGCTWKKPIEGYRIPPFYFFVLGDNRNQSIDSRHPKGMGLIPQSYLFGRVLTSP